MTLGHFVVKNAFRNVQRTFLTVGSIAFSLFLLLTLHSALNRLLNPPASKESDLRVAVRRSTSLADLMPIAYEREIAKIPHVKLTMPLQWYGGQYIKPENFFPNFACVPEKFWDIFPEATATDDVKKAFLEERRGAIVGERLASRFKWKVGDTITLKGAIFPADLELKIVGLVKSDQQSGTLYFHYDYMNEALRDAATGKTFDQVGAFWVMADSAASIPGIIEAIDAKFRNSPAETKSETEKSFVLAFAQMLGNVKALVGAIAGVVVFTMLLVTASSMAMTIRERFREVGILKSLGFSGGLVLALIMGEAVFVSSLGIGLGCAGALALGWFDFSGGGSMMFLENLRPTGAGYALTVAAGLAIGLLSGFIPALQASRLTITQAMRRLD